MLKTIADMDKETDLKGDTINFSPDENGVRIEAAIKRTEKLILTKILNRDTVRKRLVESSKNHKQTYY